MLKLADVGAEDIVYDLGSGDGRIVISAVQDFHAKRAVGIEQRENLVNTTRFKIRRLKLESKIEIVHDDVFNVDISAAKVVTLYLTSYGTDRIRLKLEEELKPSTRVVSRHYPILEWTPTQVFDNIYLYQLGKLDRPTFTRKKAKIRPHPLDWYHVFSRDESRS
jgi:hypothetical protein